LHTADDMADESPHVFEKCNKGAIRNKSSRSALMFEHVFGKCVVA